MADYGASLKEECLVLKVPLNCVWRDSELLEFPTRSGKGSCFIEIYFFSGLITINQAFFAHVSMVKVEGVYFWYQNSQIRVPITSSIKKCFNFILQSWLSPNNVSILFQFEILKFTITRTRLWMRIISKICLHIRSN